MNLIDKHITVVGGGIGGLAVALALVTRGAQVTVLEQAEAIKEVGAGLQISPNGLCVLRALGLEEELAARSTRAHSVTLRNHADGAKVAHLDLGALPQSQRYYFVHRADLIDILYGAAKAKGVDIRLLQNVDDVVPGRRPEIRLRNGDHYCSDLVIGADGLHSRLRPRLNPNTRARFTSQVAWRAIIPNTVGQGAEAQVYMGPGRHLVCYPLRDGATLNLVAAQERASWTEEGWNHLDDPANLRAAFAAFGPDVQRRLDLVETVHLWGLFRHPVARHWVGENVALLGDAAHPTLPFLAQGANMAFEDAWVLTCCLDSNQDHRTALETYQAVRHSRCTRIVAAANANAWKYHLRPGPIRFAAHTALRLGARLAPERLLHRFDWLYGYDVTQAWR